MTVRARMIHNFPLERSERQTVEVVGYLDKLDVQIQGGNLTLWCSVLTPGTEAVPLAIYIVGTGTPIPEGISLRTYWRTVQDGRYVWHIFIQEGVRT